MADEGKLRHHLPRVPAPHRRQVNRNLIQNIHESQHAAEHQVVRGQSDPTEGRVQARVNGEDQRAGD